VSRCYAGIYRSQEIAIYDLRVAAGRHSCERTIVAVWRGHDKEFRLSSSMTLLGFTFQESGRWILVILNGNLDDAHQISAILDYLIDASDT
jgi:hypothetical protein